MEDKVMVKVFNFLTLVTPVTNDWDPVAFGAFCCMIMEEWCRTNNQDVVAYVQYLADQVNKVHEEHGTY